MKRTVTYYISNKYFSFTEFEIYEVPMSILPTKSSSRKLKRAINRLLPVGHRYRGDVQVAA